MATLTYEYYGQPLTHQKVTPGNTATALSANCYNYKRWKLNFDAGTDEMVVGDWIVGASSAAVARIVSITVSSGTWAGDDVVGYLIIDSMVGTWTNNEKLKVAADATMADVNGSAAELMEDYEFRGCQAKSALVVVTANTALVNLTGGKPDQTSLIGLPIYASSTVHSSILLKDINEIRNFKVIDYTASTAGYTWVTYFF